MVTFSEYADVLSMTCTSEDEDDARWITSHITVKEAKYRVRHNISKKRKTLCYLDSFGLPLSAEAIDGSIASNDSALPKITHNEHVKCIEKKRKSSSGRASLSSKSMWKEEKVVSNSETRAAGTVAETSIQPKQSAILAPVQILSLNHEEFSSKDKMIQDNTTDEQLLFARLKTTSTSADDKTETQKTFKNTGLQSNENDAVSEAKNDFECHSSAALNQSEPSILIAPKPSIPNALPSDLLLKKNPIQLERLTKKNTTNNSQYYKVEVVYETVLQDCNRPSSPSFKIKKLGEPKKKSKRTIQPSEDRAAEKAQMEVNESDDEGNFGNKRKRKVKWLNELIDSPLSKETSGTRNNDDEKLWEEKIEENKKHPKSPIKSLLKNKLISNNRAHSGFEQNDISQPYRFASFSKEKIKVKRFIYKDDDPLLKLELLGTKSRS